jgi:hypothetical protein
VKEIWQNAKNNKQVIHFKNFQQPEITWEDALKFIYDLSKIPNEDLTKRSGWNKNNMIFGSVLAHNGYFLFDENNLFSIFKGVTELMEKVNDGDSGKNCCYYTKEQRGSCNCGQQWHIQALRFSISDHSVSDHNDPNDVLYWQLLGKSRWIMNKEKEYILEPGDLLYFNQEDSHEVLQDGPRAGIIIDGIKPGAFIGKDN